MRRGGLTMENALASFPDIAAGRRVRMDGLAPVKVLTPAASVMPVLFRLRLATMGYALSPCGPMYAPKTPLEKREPRFVPGRIASQHASNTSQYFKGLGSSGAILRRTLGARRPRRRAGAIHAVAPGAYRLSQDRRGARWPPQDRGARPRRRAAAPGIRCPVSGKSATMMGARCDGFFLCAGR